MKKSGVKMTRTELIRENRKLREELDRRIRQYYAERDLQGRLLEGLPESDDKTAAGRWIKKARDLQEQVDALRAGVQGIEEATRVVNAVLTRAVLSFGDTDGEDRVVQMPKVEVEALERRYILDAKPLDGMWKLRVRKREM